MLSIQEKETFQAPRELVRWLERLDLTYQITNFSRDLSNGYIVAEILSRYDPKLNINSFYNDQALTKRFHNWERLKGILQTMKYNMSSLDINNIIFKQENRALEFLMHLYNLLNQKELKWQFPAKIDQPNYRAQTINFLMKNRAVNAIVANHQKAAIQKEIVENHNRENKEKKSKLKLREYMDNKKRLIITRELEKIKLKKLKLDKIEKKTIETETLQLQNYKRVENINSNNICLSDRRQGFLESIGDLIRKNFKHFLNKSNNFLFEEKNFEEMCNEPKNFDFEFISVVFTILCENAKELVDKINSNITNLRIFFEAILRFILKVPNEPKYLGSFEKFFVNFGYFLQKDCGDLLVVIMDNTVYKLVKETAQKRRDKKDFLAILLHNTCSRNPFERVKTICKLKELFESDLHNFIEIAARISIYEVFDDSDLVYFNTMLYYAILCAKYPQNSTVRASLKIFFEISDINFYKVMYELYDINLSSLIYRNDWEITSLIMLIACKIIKYLDISESEEVSNYDIVKNKPGLSIQPADDDSKVKQSDENMSSDINSYDHLSKHEVSLTFDNANRDKEPKAHIDNLILDKYKAYYLDLINKTFTQYENMNVIRLGIVYIAPMHANYSELTDHYFSVLASLNLSNLESILTEDDIDKQSKMIMGYNSYEYYKTGAHLSWNSLSILKSLIKALENSEKQILDEKYCFLIYSCLKKQIDVDNCEGWLEVYVKLENIIINTFNDVDNCGQALDILKTFLSYEFIVESFLSQSSDKLYSCLEKLYRKYIFDLNHKCILNFYELLRYLVEHERFKTFIFDILKKFSEKNFYVFKESKLCDLMNRIARKRRIELFGENFLENLVAI